MNQWKHPQQLRWRERKGRERIIKKKVIVHFLFSMALHCDIVTSIKAIIYGKMLYARCIKYLHSFASPIAACRVAHKKLFNPIAWWKSTGTQWRWQKKTIIIYYNQFFSPLSRLIQLFFSSACQPTFFYIFFFCSPSRRKFFFISSDEIEKILIEKMDSV